MVDGLDWNVTHLHTIYRYNCKKTSSSSVSILFRSESICYDVFSSLFNKIIQSNLFFHSQILSLFFLIQISSIRITFVDIIEQAFDKLGFIRSIIDAF
jgi:hypothetical protein